MGGRRVVSLYRVAIVEDEADQADALRRMMERSAGANGSSSFMPLMPPRSRSCFPKVLVLDILMMDIELGSRGENGSRTGETVLS